jgi:hypothetical protein
MEINLKSCHLHLVGNLYHLPNTTQNVERGLLREGCFEEKDPVFTTNIPEAYYSKWEWWTEQSIMYTDVCFFWRAVYELKWVLHSWAPRPRNWWFLYQIVWSKWYKVLVNKALVSRIEPQKPRIPVSSQSFDVNDLDFFELKALLMMTC